MPHMLNIYRAKFIGRRRGALGERYEIEVSIVGMTPQDARLALYENFEHISSLTLRKEDGTLVVWDK
jgi:hypothetical protein